MAVITPNTEVRLIKNVPFSNNYKNVILFKSRNAQETYFKSLPSITKDNFKYQRNNGTIMYPLPKDEALQYNYIMYKNTSFSNKYFYAFITNIRYVNPNTCAIEFELDVFQTWYLDTTWQPSFISRQHCRRWNSDGSPVINTVPEALDYGSEYVIKGIKRLYDMGAKAQIKWLVFAMSLEKSDIIGSNADLYRQMSIGAGITTNLQYIVTPINEYGISSEAHIYINGSEMPNGYGMIQYLQNEPIFANKTNSIFVTDFLPFEYSVSQTGSNISITSKNLALASIGLEGEDMGYIKNFPFIVYQDTDDARNNPISFTFNDKYSSLKSGITESKLLMYPYSYNLLTDLQGDNFIIKNEYVDGNNINISIRSAIDIANKVSYTVTNYLGGNLLSGYNYLDNGIINANDNRITVRDSYSSAYIQGNMNQIRQSIIATQQQTALTQQITQNNANTRYKINDVQALGNLVGSTVNGGASILTNPNNVGSAIGGVINTGIQYATNYATTTIENTNMLNNTALRGELANQQAIESINAKIQDARNVADNTVLQGGNASFNYGYENMGCKIIAKQITPEYIDILQDYFKKYGYAYHRIEVPNLNSREAWNYIQTVGANIVGNIPQIYIDALEGIFNSGVTLWHNTNVGNYNQSNNEI